MMFCGCAHIDEDRANMFWNKAEENKRKYLRHTYSRYTHVFLCIYKRESVCIQMNVYFAYELKANPPDYYHFRQLCSSSLTLTHTESATERMCEWCTVLTTDISLYYKKANNTSCVLRYIYGSCCVHVTVHFIITIFFQSLFYCTCYFQIIATSLVHRAFYAICVVKKVSRVY